MDSFDRLFEILIRRNLAVGLLAASLAVFCAAAVRMLVPFQGHTFVTFVPAVLVTAFVGGWLPACCAACGSLIYAWYFLLPLPGFLPAGSSALTSVLAISLIFAAQILCIEVVRMAAFRAVQRRERADELLEERDVMFHELQHRVANNMQFISSLLTIQGRQLPAGERGRDAMLDAADRLRRFATVHRRLHDAHRADRAFEPLAREVLADLLHATGYTDVVLDVSADPVELSLDTLTTLILITTEAATNAVKHVFSRGAGHCLTVRLQRFGQAELELSIADDGPGFADAVPGGGASLGFRIVRSLVQRLQGKMYAETEAGAVLRVIFPAAVVGRITGSDTVPGAGTEPVAVRSSSGQRALV